MSSPFLGSLSARRLTPGQFDHSAAMGKYAMNEERDSLVLLLLREGSTDQAIKLVQEETGLHYVDAKRKVHRFASRNGIRSHGSGAWVIAFFLTATILGFLTRL